VLTKSSLFLRHAETGGESTMGRTSPGQPAKEQTLDARIYLYYTVGEIRRAKSFQRIVRRDKQGRSCENAGFRQGTVSTVPHAPPYQHGFSR